MKTHIGLLGLALPLSLGCEQGKTPKTQYKSERSLSAEANESSAASRYRPNTLQETQTERKTERAAPAVKNQSEIIEDAIRTHLHAKTGFTPEKEIKGEPAQADLARVAGLDFSYSKSMTRASKKSQ